MNMRYFICFITLFWSIVFPIKAQADDVVLKQANIAMIALKDAKVALQEGKLDVASEEVQRGLDAIGRHYLIEDIVDDTGLKLIYATSKEVSAKESIHIRIRVLRDRLVLLNRKLKFSSLLH